MFRKLLFLLLIACSTDALAQHATMSPIKSDPKKGDTLVDYKVVGAPMPPLNLKVFKDTSGKIKPGMAQKDTTAKRVSPVDVSGTAVSGKESEAVPHKRKKKADKTSAGTGKNEQVAGKSKDYLTNADFDNGANLFVMMFNPTCSHCEDETELLEKNIFLFNKSKIILMANPMMADYLPNFVKSFRVMEYPTITLGTDSTFISRVFLYSALPQINIYDQQRKLIKAFAGEVAIDSLKQYIH